ncbi:hypothetical protein B0T22DRAFT_482962 [Podospora appendiculata]|uniref:Calcofluor white hypersensitive protein n=1 Tax=Podospora appendiculata TaxID=314037 RepID=A0AAE0X6U4_9PEZI|nr:hypothetical protein B0T22DRAFT_482962 [Podospora appendiculata]
MSKSRAPLVLGAGALGAVGYYLYSSGGDPSLAKKQVERDSHRAAENIKEKLPSSSANYKKDGQEVGKEIGAKFDNAVSSTEKELTKIKNDTETYAKQARADTLKKIDEIDRKVEEGAAKSKGYFSSWFGGK